MTITGKYLFGFLGAASILASCAPGDGLSPPVDVLYFPVSLSVTGDGKHLLVVNSDFDLQYSQGTIHSLDLDRVRQLTRIPCAADRDCDADSLCDVVPTEENGGVPSFYCVDSETKLPCGPVSCETGIGNLFCDPAAEKSRVLLAVSPGRCAPIDLDQPPDGGTSLIADLAETSAFATQGLLLNRPCSYPAGVTPCRAGSSPADWVQDASGTSHGQRLFIPIRGDTAIHYLDITDQGHFRCGRVTEKQGAGVYLPGKNREQLRCSSAYNVGKGTTFALSASGEVTETDEVEDPSVDHEIKEKDKDPGDEFRIQPELFDLSASSDGRAIVVSHQLGGRASALLNSWLDPPVLVDILSDLPPNPIGVAALPRDQATTEQSPGFLLSYRTKAQVDLLRFQDDGLIQATSPAGPTPEQIAKGEIVFRPSLERTAGTNIALNSLGFDSRGILVDGRRREAALVECADDEDCLATASRIPAAVYVASRSPNSLLIGRSAGEDPDAKVSSIPEFYDSVPLTSGPSRVVLGEVTDPAGDRQPRIFVICFDSALIYVYDPDRRVVESVIRTGRGPHAMAFDPQRSLAYVAHFTDSYVAVISLDHRFPMSFGTTLATLGTPEPPRATQ